MKMSNLFDQIKVLFENQLYSNVVALASFALSMDQNSEATSPEKFQTYVYYGNSLFHLGQYRRAEAMYNKALQFRKGFFKCVGSNKTSASLKEFMPDIDIKYQIHLCHINLKQNQEAVTVLETIPGKQRSPKVNMALGKLYQLGGMERSSVYAFKEVLKECPLALEAIEGLLNLRLSGAEVQSFVLECAAQKGVTNIDWVLSWIKAHDQINSREYGHAITTLKQMDKHSCIKNNHNLLIMLGETYYNAGDSKNALSVLQRAHLIEPQLEKGLDMLASLLAKEKRLPELEKLVPTYVPLREYGSETWIAMAYYLYVNKKTNRAAYLAQKACLLNPRNVEGLLLKAAIFLDLKKYQDSVVHYREAMHLSPYRYEAYEGLVNCYVAMHRLREALTVASGVCKQLGQNPRTLTLYASVLMKDSVSVCKAKGLLEKALQQDDRYLPAVYLLVIILDQELNLERAISILEKQIQIQPNCKLHQMLGDLYSKNHQQEKATEQYMIALQMDPSNRRLQEAMSKLNQNCSKIDSSYYMAVNDDDNINTTYELGDSENEMPSSKSIEWRGSDNAKASNSGSGGQPRKSTLDSHKSSTGSQKSSLGTQKSSIGTNKSSLGTQKSSIGTNKSSLGTQKSSIGTNKSSLGTQKSSIGTQKSSTGTRKSTVVSLLSKPPVINKPPPKASRTEKVEYQTRDITVTMPVVISGVQKSSLGMDDDEVSEDEERLATVPAKEVTKITTVEEISPSSVKNVVVTKLEPIITVNQFLDKEITEIRTPLKKHITTTTTVKKTTLVTTETTTIVGGPGYPGSTQQ